MPPVVTIKAMFSNIVASSALDDDGFLIFAEVSTEGVGDFADGGVGFDGSEDGGKEIFCCRGAALEFGKGGLNAGGIASGTESVEAGDLRALDFLVDPERGNSAFFFSNEIVDADDDLLFFFDGALEFERDFLKLALNEAGFDGPQHSA